MKKCAYCAEEIQDEAIVCKHCGRDLRVPVQPVSLPPPQSPPVATVSGQPSSKSNPGVGCIGCVTLLAGVVICSLSGSNSMPGAIVAAIGAIILVYALATGQIKLFG